jgi:hypothetical protein
LANGWCWAVTAWDPFEVLWLPHEARVPEGDVLRGYARRMRVMYLTVHDHSRWPAEAARFRRALWALCTPRRRRQVIADLLVQPGMPPWLKLDPEPAALHDALLSPLTGGLDDALDRRALEREAALMRLECRAAGRQPWPPSRLQARPGHRRR